MTHLIAPPREPDPPREQWPMGIMAAVAIAIIVIFGGLLIATPNVGGF